MSVVHTLRPYLLVALLNVSEGMITMLVPPYMDSLGFTPAAIGLLVSVAAAASLASRLPAGALYQGRRARALILGALVVVALVSLLYPLATDATSLVIVRVLHGMAYGLATTVNLALFIDLIPPSASRHHAMGHFTAALAGGFTAGQAVAGFVGDWYGYGWAFVLAAAPPLLALGCVDAPPAAPRPRRSGGSPREGRLRGGLSTTLRALKAPGILPLALLAFFLAFYLNVQSTFVPLYALAIGLGLAEIGLLKSFHSVCNSVTRPFSGGFIARVGPGRIAIASLALNALLLFLVPSLTTMVALSALMIVIGLVRGLAMVANTISVAADVDESQVSRGLASGIYYASRDLGAILGPVLAGGVAGLVGVEGMLRLVPPLALAAYLVGVVASRRYAPGPAPAPARAQ